MILSNRYLHTGFDLIAGGGVVADLFVFRFVGHAAAFPSGQL